jgi:hypothetical protein
MVGHHNVCLNVFYEEQVANECQQQQQCDNVYVNPPHIEIPSTRAVDRAQYTIM